MNAFINLLATDAWTHLVQALMHTLWIGVIAAAGLVIALKRTSDSAARYRWCQAALCLVLLGGLVAWGLLEQPKPSTSFTSAVARRLGVPASAGQTHAIAQSVENFSEHLDNVEAPPAEGGTPNLMPWLALTWLIGAAAMLARAGWLVADAEKLCRRCRPLDDKAIMELVAETKAKLGLARRIRVVVTEQLTSPAVVGIFVPTLILPLSLFTSLSMSQIQVILLHELAHVRQGDYLANLCQLVAESALFFNPAVWWISRQIRQEREAACDASAIALTGGRIELARTLAQVAEEAWGAMPAAAAGVAGNSGPSGLKDRVRRLLVPGYRPALRLTRMVTLGSLSLGIALLFLSAAGTRLTVALAANLLTPKERIDRIEKTMTKLGAAPEGALEGQAIDAEVILRMKDGSEPPKDLYPLTYSNWKNTSTFGPLSLQNGVFKGTVHRGDVAFLAWNDNLGPAFVGLINCRSSNSVRMELTLDPGFPLDLHIADADTGEPIDEASVALTLVIKNNTGSTGYPFKKSSTDKKGDVEFQHCSTMRISMNIQRSGYETTQKEFETLKPGKRVEIRIKKAPLTSGVAIDTTTGKPISGAEIFFLASDPGLLQMSAGNPWEPRGPLATSDESGRFKIDSLPRGAVYYLLVATKGRCGALLSGVKAGQTNLEAFLGPELVVRGRVTGSLADLGKEPKLQCLTKYGHYGHGNLFPIRVEAEIGYFEFTYPFAGEAKITIGDHEFSRTVTNSITDWPIQLAGNGKTRPVILRFEHSSGVPPKGTISVTAVDGNSRASMRREMAITNGEVKIECVIDKSLSYEPAQTIGYWFPQKSIQVPAGEGPFVINVPIIPAGAISGTIRNVDGSAALDASMTLLQPVRSPWVSNAWVECYFHPTQAGDQTVFVANPIPLAGTYAIMAWRGYEVCVSQSVPLTAARPNQKVGLQFKPKRVITGQILGPDNQPLTNAKISIDWNYSAGSYGCGLPAITLDDQARFRFEGCDPAPGDYTLELKSPGMRSMFQSLDLTKLPLTVRMQTGLKLSGKAINAKTGAPLAGAKVRIYSQELHMPREETTANEKGEFLFDTLNEADYSIYVEGQHEYHNDVFRPGGKPVLLKIK